MVLVAGTPFIDHQLRLVAGQGIQKVVICIGYLGEQIEEYVGDGSRFGCNVLYSRDGSTPRGTGGAVTNALPLLGSHFFVMYGDSYLPINFRLVYETFLAAGTMGLMTVFRNENRWDISNVTFRESRILTYNKVNRTPDMQYIDYGLGILRSSVFEEWKDVEAFDLSAVYGQLVSRDCLSGYETKQRFYEIGTQQGLCETDKLLRSA